MVQKRLEKGNTYIDVKYDEAKYQIEHVKDSIILIRLSDNKILEVFNHNIGFIVEYDDEDKVNFIMTDYSEYMQDKTKPFMLKHFVDVGDNELKLFMATSCNDTLLENLFINDNIYSTGDSNSGVYLYNLKCLSKKFDHIYSDKRICEIFGNNTILVDEVIKSLYYPDISDTITYGINQETYEITTPIYSELQNRYIQVYTEEKIKEVTDKLKKQGIWINPNYSNVEITMDLEIQHYIDELSKCIQKKNSVYLNSVNNEINKDFIKKFVKTI